MKSIIKILVLCILSFGIYSLYPVLAYRMLQSAVKTQNTDTVAFLLKIGVAPDPDESVKKWYFEASLQNHPLHYAAKHGNFKIAQLLIENSAKIDACCCSCITPLHVAIIEKNENIVKLLLEAGASTNLFYDTQFPAKELARKYSTPEIRQLIESNYQIRTRD